VFDARAAVDPGVDGSTAKAEVLCRLDSEAPFDTFLRQAMPPSGEK
jgi:hypothetical protein